jgi:hypothetical protein
LRRSFDGGGPLVRCERQSPLVSKGAGKCVDFPAGPPRAKPGVVRENCVVFPQ